MGGQQVAQCFHTRGSALEGYIISHVGQAWPQIRCRLDQLRAHEQGLNLRIVDNILDLISMEPRVERRDYEPALHGRTVNIGVLQAVPGKNANPIAFLTPERLERMNEAIDPC